MVRLSVVLLLLLLVVGCGKNELSTPTSKKLNVAVAANLQFAFEDLKTVFGKVYPEIQLELTYGSSANLYAQIVQRAPFDMFFSADTKYPRRLINDGAAVEADYFPYAQGGLVILFSPTAEVNHNSDGLKLLTDPAIQKVAIANPKLAPYGEAAVETLKNVGIYESIADKLVFGDNVTQAAQFVTSGAADAGIVARSLGIAIGGVKNTWDVPDQLYQPIGQAAVICAHSENRHAAKQLKDFILGIEGIKVLKEHGYRPPDHAGDL